MDFVNAELLTQQWDQLVWKRYGNCYEKARDRTYKRSPLLEIGLLEPSNTQIKIPRKKKGVSMRKIIAYLGIPFGSLFIEESGSTMWRRGIICWKILVVFFLIRYSVNISKYPCFQADMAVSLSLLGMLVQRGNGSTSAWHTMGRSITSKISYSLVLAKVKKKFYIKYPLLSSLS